MARKQSTPAVASKSSMVQLPEGFRRLGSATAECWFALKAGNTIRGKLLGCYERDDKRNKKTGKSEFFQVELLEASECRYGKGQKASFKMAQAGTIVNLNCNTKTEVLKDLMPDVIRGAEFEIFVHCGEKIVLQNGNTMWLMTPGSKMIKAPTVLAEPDFSGDGEDDGASDDTEGAQEAE